MSEQTYIIPTENKRWSVDAKPLIDLFHLIGFDDAAKSLDNALRVIACACEHDRILVDSSGLCYDLYNIRDMFKELIDNVIDNSKKEGDEV